MEIVHIRSWDFRDREDLGVVKIKSQNGRMRFGIEGSSGRRITWGRLDVTEAPKWTLRVVDFSEEALDR